MTTKSSFLPRISLLRSGNDSTSILPTHNRTSRYSTLRNQPSEYDLDELSPRTEDGFLPANFHDPNLPPKSSSSNRKPTGAVNRRPSDSSSGDSASKTRHRDNGQLLFSGPPPPIAASRILYRDEEQRYQDEEDSSAGLAASWLPGTARRAISSVIWDRAESRSGQDRSETAVVFDRNSVWRSLARRERAVVADVQRFLQVQEESLTGAPGGDDLSLSDEGSATPTASMVLSRHPGRSVSFLEPVTRSGPSGEIIPVRQPRQKKLGISGARRGIARSMAQLANLKAEEDASILSALSTRKQALAKLRNLATRRDGIADELNALETDEEEPLGKELEDLDSEHRGVCTEISKLEERLAGLKTRRRHLEGRMNDVRNRREAGLSGYKNALREVEDAVKGFLSRPPVKPLDVEALAENMKGEDHPPSPGGIEFMHLRPERRTVDMAREWWQSEVTVLEARKAEVDTERAALEEGGEVWDEVVNLVLNFESDLRKQMTKGSTTDSTTNVKDKGKDRELSAAETLKLQYEKINDVIIGLERRLGVAEEKGWNLLIAAIGAELEAFREAARVNREMLRAAGITVDESPLSVLGANEFAREDSGTTVSHNSFHTVNSGSTTLAPEPLLDLPNNHEDEATLSDNEVPPELLATHDEEHIVNETDRDGESRGDAASAVGSTLDREDSENEVPHEFLVEHPTS